MDMHPEEGPIFDNSVQSIHPYPENEKMSTSILCLKSTQNVGPSVPQDNETEHQSNRPTVSHPSPPPQPTAEIMERDESNTKTNKHVNPNPLQKERPMRKVVMASSLLDEIDNEPIMSTDNEAKEKENQKKAQTRFTRAKKAPAAPPRRSRRVTRNRNQRMDEPEENDEKTDEVDTTMEERVPSPIIQKEVPKKRSRTKPSASAQSGPKPPKRIRTTADDTTIDLSTNTTNGILITPKRSSSLKITEPSLRYRDYSPPLSDPLTKTSDYVGSDHVTGAFASWNEISILSNPANSTKRDDKKFISSDSENSPWSETDDDDNDAAGGARQNSKFDIWYQLLNWCSLPH